MDYDFTVAGTGYHYYPPHDHNNPRENERRVQLPVAMAFIERHAPNLIEIGAVTPYYRPALHPVYDATDKHPAAINVDARELTFDPDTYVLSISVMQFVGVGGYGDPVGGGKKTSPELVQRIIREAAGCYLTWPNGYNDDLDLATFSGRFTPFVHFLQRDKDNNWVGVERPTLTEYDQPYKCGNSIVMLIKE